MNSKKDINKMFRDHQHKLDERPSSRAWERLESRLDAHQRRAHRPRFGLLKIAASLLFLVAMVSLISFMFRSGETAMTASTDNFKPMTLEELNTEANNKGVYTIAVDYQRRLNQSPRYSISEGKNNKQLLAKTKSTNVSPASPAAPKSEMLAMAREENKEIEKNTPPGDLAIEEKEVTSKRDIDYTPTSIGANEAVDGVAYEDEAIADIVVTEEAEVEVLDEVVVTGYGVNKDAAGGEYTRSRQSNAKKESAPPATYDQATYPQLDAASNVMTYSAEQQNAEVDQFKWLIGNWQGSVGPDKHTQEQWQQKDEFTIEGKGQLVVNGQTIFTEGMKIQKKGKDLYFIVAVDQDNREVRYKLKSYTPQMMVFEKERKKKELPEQLIIQQHSHNNFSTIIQNSETNNLNQSQQLYLQNRNYVEEERTVRNLSRVGND